MLKKIPSTINGAKVETSTECPVIIAPTLAYADTIRAILDQTRKHPEILAAVLDYLKESEKSDQIKYQLEKEFELDLFPVSKVFEFIQWRGGYCQYWNYHPQKIKLIEEFELKV